MEIKLIIKHSKNKMYCRKAKGYSGCIQYYNYQNCFSYINTFFKKQIVLKMGSPSYAVQLEIFMQYITCNCTVQRGGKQKLICNFLSLDDSW
jgi:hypothetical protein